ncbi:hypothetical protein ACFQ6Q_00470 [Streptomyces sp. NPDC056437]|uniref:hypothetical protein n=1 Tax=Streptomyces sp. NPDC056437 TaxID=3345816 RepID=UPI0036C71FA8
MRRPALHTPTTADVSAWARPYPTGTFSPYFYNGDPATPPAGGDPNPADPPKPGPPASRTFTQDDLTALAAKEKAQGERAGARAALEKFAADHGFSTIEDAKAFIEEGRKAKEAQLTDQQRKEQELTDLQAKLEQDRLQLAADRRANVREQALARLGAFDLTDDQGRVTTPNLQDALAMLDRDLRDEPDAEPDRVAAVAAALKTRRPELFGTTAPAPAPQVLPPAPSGAPAGGPPARTVPTGKDAIKNDARARAERMGLRDSDAA